MCAGAVREETNASAGGAEERKSEEAEPVTSGHGTRQEVTLANVQALSTYELRQELVRRGRYNEKTDGEATYKNFLRIMVGILEEERREAEKLEFERKEAVRVAEMQKAKQRREQRKLDAANRTMGLAKKLESCNLSTEESSKKPETNNSRVFSADRLGSDRIPVLRMPRRF